MEQQADFQEYRGENSPFLVEHKKPNAPLYAEFEEHAAAYMELKELAQRLQTAKEQCEDITKRLNQAKLTKEEANALLQNLAKLQTAPKQDTTDETISSYHHAADEDEEGQTLLQKFVAQRQTNEDIEKTLAAADIAFAAVA